MIARVRLLLAVLSAALLCGSCAVPPEIRERRESIDAQIDAILNEPLDVEQYGTMQRCLSDREYRNFRAIDDRHILFEGRRETLWINTLRTRCPDLRYGTVLVTSSSPMGRMCELDTFVAGDWFTWPWYRRWPWHWGTAWNTGARCTLGKFQPITDDQLEAMEALIRSR